MPRPSTFRAKVLVAFDAMDGNSFDRRAALANGSTSNVLVALPLPERRQQWPGDDANIITVGLGAPHSKRVALDLVFQFKLFEQFKRALVD